MFARLFGAPKKAPVSPSQDRLELLALLAKLVYLDRCPNSDDVPNGVVPYGWWDAKAMEPFEKSYGYGGCGFVIFEEEEVWGRKLAKEIFIVHKGTSLSEPWNIIGDLEVAMNQVPLQITPAMINIKSIINALKQDFDFVERGDDFWKIPVTHVGHSLGAVIANCILLTYPEFVNSQCITFENPGCKKVALNYMMTNLKMSMNEAQSRANQLESQVVSYQTDVNIINSCNDQWGAVKHIKIPYRYTFPDHASLPIATDNIGKTYLLNNYYLLTYSVYDQHGISNLLYHLKKKPEIVDASDRKGGFANGYLEYLDGVKRKDYWVQYFDIVWKSNDEIQRVFHNKYSAFETFMFGLLEDDRKLALINPPNKLKELDTKLQMESIFSRANTQIEEEEDEYIMVSPSPQFKAS